MTDGAIVHEPRSVAVPHNLTGSAAIALIVGAVLAWCARSGAVQLLVAITGVQAMLAFAWLLGLRLPGRVGGVVIVALGAGTADVAVSVWPHSRLGTLLVVLGLAVPVMFVHQLGRGAARVRIVESLGGLALLVVAEVSVTALLQLRHEFTHGGDVVFAVVVVGAGALVIGDLADLVMSAPRFDGGVPRGLLAVAASTAVGAALGHFSLHDEASFAGGRGALAGAVLGGVVTLLAVAVAFVEDGAPPEADLGRRARPVLAVVFPLSVLAPAAFVLCLALRA